MIPEIDEELLRQAVSAFGMEAQMTMAIEECAELITAITQLQRGRPSNVIEEIADVTILMAQLRLIYGASAIDEVISQKMDRLRVRLNAPLTR